MKTKIYLTLGAIVLSSNTYAEEYQTNFDKIQNQPPIVINITDNTIPSNDVTAVLRGLEHQIKGGTRFKDGETLQLGFMVNQFSLMDDGRLRLEEPDMKSVPVKFLPTMNYTFKTLRAQKDIVESIGSTQLSYPSVQQAIAIHKDFKTASAVLLERVAPEESQSGWWVHVRNSQPEDYSLTSIFQFALERPDLVKFLALPVGAKIYIIKGSPIKIFIDDKEVEILTGSFLAELNKVANSVQ